MDPKPDLEDDLVIYDGPSGFEFLKLIARISANWSASSWVKASG